MKRDALRSRKPHELRIEWRDGENTTIGATAEDSFDDRVSEDIFDFEDEHIEVDRIVRAGSRDAH